MKKEIYENMKALMNGLTKKIDIEVSGKVDTDQIRRNQIELYADTLLKLNQLANEINENEIVAHLYGEEDEK